MITNADKILFHSSSTDILMTNDRKATGMGETCKKKLLEVYAYEKYSRYEEVTSKYFEKGNFREEDGLTLVSRAKKKLYKKNSTRLYNNYLSGEIDAFEGVAINKADEIIDIKCCFSLLTFLKSKQEENEKYFYQMQSYMALSGANKASVCYCLVNGTVEQILNEKRFLNYQNLSEEKHISRCKQIEINHIFDIKHFISENPDFVFHNELGEWKYNIPYEERLHVISFDRDENEIEKLYNRLIECREWMNKNLFKK